MQHTLVAEVEDKPGVLMRVVSLFRKRNFNIDSLTVSNAEVAGRSRMTIVYNSSQKNTNRLIAYLNKLINVVHVEELTHSPMICRDLALMKVSANGQNRTEIMQFVETFRARIVDVARDSLVIEITGDSEKILSFMQMMQPFGILEFARSGAVGMARGRSKFSPSYTPEFQQQTFTEPALVRS